MVLESILFTSGLATGVLGKFVYDKINDRLDFIKNVKKPFLKVSTLDIEDFEFLSRQGDIVTIAFFDETDDFENENYEVNKFIYLNLAKQTITAFEDGEILFTQHESLKLEFILFYQRLINMFNTEIYVDIIDVNGIPHSTNLFSDEDLDYLEGGDMYEDEMFYDEENDDLSKLKKTSKPKITLTLDSVLDKVSKTGMDSLTKEEKDFLDNQSKK